MNLVYVTFFVQVLSYAFPQQWRFSFLQKKKKKPDQVPFKKNKMWDIKLESNILNHISENQGQENSYSKTISVL